MKLFSLLHGDKVARSSKTKVVPATEFSTLMDAKEVLETTVQDTETYRQEVIAEVEKLKEEAEIAGFQQGLAQLADQLKLVQDQIETIRDEMRESVVPIALQAAKKIVGREMSLDPSTISDIVANSLKSVAGHRKVSIYCHKDDLAQLQAEKEELKTLFERLDSLAITNRDDIEQGGCVIETEAGIINAQWSHMWQVLEHAFQTLLNK